MVKKISFLILSVAILVIGVIAFSKLSYWDRTVRIFSFSSDAPFEGRMGRGPEGREEFGEGGRFNRQERSGEGFARPEMLELPDSIRARFEAREGRPGQGMRDRNIPDSLRQQLGPRDGERMERGPIEGGMRNGEGPGRGEFPGGKKINIRNVKWFLAVFASFVVIAIYTDKTVYLVRKRKGRQQAIKGIMISLAFTVVCSLWWETAGGQTKDPLLFPRDNFTVETKTVKTSLGEKKVTYLSYLHIPYVANPVDKDYESMNVSVPIKVDDVAIDAINAPILFVIGVGGGYMSSNNARTGPSNSQGGGMGGPPAGGNVGGDPGGPGGTGRVSGKADLALAAGYVVVSPGCRGRDNKTTDGTYYGKAPAAILPDPISK